MPTLSNRQQVIEGVVADTLLTIQICGEAEDEEEVLIRQVLHSDSDSSAPSSSSSDSSELHPGLAMLLDEDNSEDEAYTANLDTAINVIAEIGNQ